MENDDIKYIGQKQDKFILAVISPYATLNIESIKEYINDLDFERTTVIENKFNRMIIYDGRALHSAEGAGDQNAKTSIYNKKALMIKDE